MGKEEKKERKKRRDIFFWFWFWFWWGLGADGWRRKGEEEPAPLVFGGVGWRGEIFGCVLLFRFKITNIY